MMNKFLIAALAFLASPLAQATHLNGSAYKVYRVPSTGGAAKFGAIDVSQSAAVTGQLPVANGGTGASTSAGARANLLVVPTIQKFTATGTTTGYLFNISTSSTCAIGDTYTNNGNTYTVLNVLSAQSGNVLAVSGASAPTASGTLTRATGSGTSSITFTSQVATGTYTTPTNPSPIYLHIRMVGGGGGGSGSGTTGMTTGGVGSATVFGGNLLLANGGGGGNIPANNSAPAVGGGTSVNLSLAIGVSFSGNAGNPGTSGMSNGTGGYSVGGDGGASVFGGSGSGSYAAGNSAYVNSGSAGGGGGTGPIAGVSPGHGGGAGGYVDVIINNPGASYPVVVGSGGAGGGAGTSGSAGGAGAAGLIIVEEHYQ